MKINYYFYHFKQIFLIPFSIFAIIIVLNIWLNVPDTATGWYDEFSKEQIMWYAKFIVLCSIIILLITIIRYINYLRNENKYKKKYISEVIKFK